MILGIDKSTGKALLKCDTCGEQFYTDIPDDMCGDELWPVLRSILNNNVACDHCAEESRRKAQAADRAIMEAESVRACIDSGVPAGMARGDVYSRNVANWLWQTTARAPSNAMLTGLSGSGKTTSACACLHRLVSMGHQVRYWRSLGDFANEYLNAKRGSGDSLGAFWRRMGMLRLLVIDEVSDSTTASPLTREALFALVDRAYSGDLHGLWLLGNIVPGSLECMADDPVVLRRRLRDAFRCGLIHADGTVEEARP